MKKESKKSSKNGAEVQEKPQERPKLKPIIQEQRMNEKGSLIVLKNVRAAFVSIAKPNTKYSKKDTQGNAIDGTYELTALIPKAGSSALVSQLYKIIEQTIKRSDRLKSPEDRELAYKTATALGKDAALLKDGDKKNKEGKTYEGCEGHFTLKATTDAVPTPTGFSPKVAFKIVDRAKNPIREHEIADRVYSGVWVDVAINLVPWKNAKGECSVTKYLAGVQVLFDDTRLGGSDPFSVRDDLDEYAGVTANAEVAW